MCRLFENKQIGGGIVGQTNLNLGELLTELKDPNSRYPRCLVINEIGELCLKGNAGAEAALVDILKDGKECHKVFAFCWLSILNKMEEKNLEAFRKFKEDPANGAVLKAAEPLLVKHYLKKIEGDF